MQDTQQQDPFEAPYQDPSQDPAHPSWLTTPGATFDPATGTVTLADGTTQAVPPGYARDPQTGNIRYTGANGTPMTSVTPGGGQQNLTNTGITPPPPAGPPPPPGGGSGGPAPPPVPSNLDVKLPTFTPPTPFQPPPAFSYADFAPPTGKDVLNDPQFQFEFGQGMQAIGAKNAALGTLNTGGTIKDFQNFGTGLASADLQNIYNRNLSTYQTNRGNALDAYNTNYGTQYKDPYQINYQTQYTDPFNLNSGNILQNYNIARFNNLDAFDQQYKLLGLL